MKNTIFYEYLLHSNQYVELFKYNIYLNGNWKDYLKILNRTSLTSWQKLKHLTQCVIASHATFTCDIKLMYMLGIPACPTKVFCALLARLPHIRPGYNAQDFGSKKPNSGREMLCMMSSVSGDAVSSTLHIVLSE